MLMMMKKGAIMEQLLTYYLIHKFQNYKPKAGKGKGIPFFSWEKYCASVLSITSMAPKDVARHLKISYGVLRIWKTEAQFKELVAKHREEFILIFIKYAHEKGKEAEQQAKSIFKKSLREIADTASLVIVKYDELNDADLYGDALVDGILLFYGELVDAKWKNIEKTKKQKFDVVKEMKSMNFMDSFRTAIRALLFKIKKTHKDKKLMRALRREGEMIKKEAQVIRLGLIVSLLLCEEKLTKNRKKRIVYILSAMKKEAREELEEAREELEKEVNKKTKDSA